MYIPRHFEQGDERALWDFVDAHAFGTLLTVVDGRPFASHLPFLTDREAGLLHCHVARANPQWQYLAGSPQVFAIFAGPHGYVSPTWYAEEGGVPTWNYSVVHAHGTATVVDDLEHKSRHVEALAARYERGRKAPWVPKYDARRLAGIVGLEIRVSKLEGKFKLSQNRSAADRAGVVAQLLGSGREDDAALARLMTDFGPPS
jgi:transcriptional regulator